jgi:hypothetical protein
MKHLLRRVYELFGMKKGNNKEKYSEIEGVLRLYIYPTDYSLVWKGNVTVDQLLQQEKQLFKKYANLNAQPYDDSLKTKKVRYLLSKDLIEFKLDGSVEMDTNHSYFLNENKDKITFARIDNLLFTLWADIYEKTKDKRSEIGIKLTKDVIEDVIYFFDNTNFGKIRFYDKKREDIINRINQSVKGNK